MKLVHKLEQMNLGELVAYYVGLIVVYALLPEPLAIFKKLLNVAALATLCLIFAVLIVKLRQPNN